MSAIQDQLNARGDVRLTGPLTVDRPLEISAGTYFDGHGHEIKATFDGPVFVTPTNAEARRFSIRRVRLVGGGIELRKYEPAGPSFFTIEDVEITRASVAVQSLDVGLWMGTFRRVHAVEGVDGFNVRTGTTLTFENCFAAHGRGRGWNLDTLYSSTLTSCAMDDHRGQAARFANCRGLTINSWYMEGNISRGGAIVLVDACDGLTVNSWGTLFNRLEAPAKGAAYLVWLNNTTTAWAGSTLGGGRRATPDTAAGDPTGHTATMILTGDTRLALQGCTVQPATKSVLEQTAFAIAGNGLVVPTGCAIGDTLAPGMAG